MVLTQRGVKRNTNKKLFYTKIVNLLQAEEDENFPVVNSRHPKSVVPDEVSQKMSPPILIILLDCGQSCSLYVSLQ